MRESELYTPVKRLLEAQGYVVRGEVRDCDVVGVRGADPAEVVVVELKSRFSLELVFQGVERQKVAEAVYLATAAPRGRRAAGRWRDAEHLCRRLGLGLIALQPGDPPRVEVVCDPDSPALRQRRAGRTLLLREFQARSGDHNVGGSARRPRVTAYREWALRIARHLREGGPTAVGRLREATGCPAAGSILQRDVYGWFERVERGVYRLAPRGEAALAEFADVLRGL